MQYTVFKLKTNFYENYKFITAYRCAKSPIHYLLQCTRETYLFVYGCRLMIATLIICHARNVHLVVLVLLDMVKTAYCDDKESIADKYVCQ